MRRGGGVTIWLIQVSEMTKTTVMKQPTTKRRMNQGTTSGMTGKSRNTTADRMSEPISRVRAGAIAIRRGTIGAITRVDMASAAPFSPTTSPDPVMYSNRNEINGMDRPNMMPQTAAQLMAANRARLLAYRGASRSVIMAQL